MKTLLTNQLVTCLTLLTIQLVTCLILLTIQLVTCLTLLTIQPVTCLTLLTIQLVTIFAGDTSEDCKEKAETESLEKTEIKKAKRTAALNSKNKKKAKKLTTDQKAVVAADEDLVLHDVGFTITIKPPSGDSFEIQVRGDASCHSL